MQQNKNIVDHVELHQLGNIKRFVIAIMAIIMQCHYKKNIVDFFKVFVVDFMHV